MADEIISRGETPPYITSDGACKTYTFVDGFDSQGRPNKWRTTTYCENETGGKPTGGGGTTVSQGSSSGMDVERWKSPLESVVAAGLTFSDPELMAEEEARIRKADQVSANFGWNAGAHSLETIPPGWQGMVSFDVPDVQGARPGGVAVGLAPVSALPRIGRNGFGHLRQGLLFTAERVRVVIDGVPRFETAYAPLRAARTAAGTDVVQALLYDGQLKWFVNGVALAVAQYTVTAPTALDATLYKAFDAVDNPRFTAGDWGEDFPELEHGSLGGRLGALQMTADATRDTELVGHLPLLHARLSQNAYADLEGALRGLRMASSHTNGLTAALPRMAMRAYESKTYGAMEVSLAPLGMAAGMAPADSSVTYSVLLSNLPRMTMTARMPPIMTINAALPALSMRASWETTYSELAAPLPALRMAAYVGEDTPLVYAMEAIGCHVPLRPIAYLGLESIERLQVASAAVLQAIVGADASERIGAEDRITVLQTFLADAMEQIGVLERARAAVLDAQGEQGGEGEAWVVNTGSNASTRYDRYGFNSFAAFGGKHYGARPDGVYLLEGATDAGRPIASGVALGQHDFGTQALKGIGAVYAGVSSTGALFLKVGDGRSHYTYRARRSDPHMKVQRFDPGRGLRTNYFTFELTSQADAFELDSVTFHVLASQRRI